MSFLVAENDGHEGHDQDSHEINAAEHSSNVNDDHTDHEHDESEEHHDSPRQKHEDDGSDHGDHSEAGEDHEAHDHGDAHGDHKGHNHDASSAQEEEEADESHDAHDHGGHSDKIILSQKAIRLFDVKIEPVRRQNLYRKITAPSRVSFNTENIAHVGATVSGRVSEIRSRIGDKVRKGQVLLVLNSPELGVVQSEFLQKLSEVETARITLEVADADYKRAKILVDGKGISEAEFLRIEGKYKVAKSALLTAEATAQALENNLHLLGMSPERVEKLAKSGEVDPVYTIFAPIDGEIIARKATVGEVVSPDNDALMTIADLDVMWVIASVPDIQLRFVDIGARASVGFDAVGRSDIEGTVTYIAPALDEKTRTGQIRIEVDNRHAGLRPGMFGRARIFPRDDDIKNTLLAVPQSAVFTVGGGPAVFVVVDSREYLFEKRSVVTGPVVDDYVPVLSGLREGDRVVTKGGFILKAELGKEGVAHEH